MWQIRMYRHMGRFSETYALMIVLNHLYEAFLLGFHFDLPHSESVFNISQDLPCAHTLLARCIPPKRDYGWLSITP